MIRGFLCLCGVVIWCMVSCKAYCSDLSSPVVPACVVKIITMYRSKHWDDYVLRITCDDEEEGEYKKDVDSVLNSIDVTLSNLGDRKKNLETMKRYAEFYIQPYILKVKIKKDADDKDNIEQENVDCLNE